MNLYVQSIKRILILISVASVSMTSALASPSEKVVFQKKMPNQGEIIVLRQEIPYVGPKELPPPPLVLVKPLHAYQYDFFLRPKKGEKTLLWSHRFLFFASDSLFPTDYTIFDADIQNDNFIVVYKSFTKTNGGTTYANIITNALWDNRKELPFPQTNLTYDSDAASVYITAAKIEGSLAQKNLSVRLTNVHTFLRYSWQKDHWQKVPDAAPAPVPSQTGTAGVPPSHP